MTKNEILEYFKDINHAYNDCTRYDTLKRMLDELQEPCEDCISRHAVLDIVNNPLNIRLDEIIKKLPPVTPAEKVGQWIARGLVDSNGNRIYECSECHHSDTQAATMIVPYCWYCGAKMQASPTGAERSDKE